MQPYVGLAFDGARVTARDLAIASLDEPVWGPRGLLADLELRLGLGTPQLDPVARLVAARERLDALALMHEGAFFVASFKVDPWSTARMLLEWRDLLVDAGWDGTSVTGAGDRIAVLADLGRDLPDGEAERLVRVEQGLRESGPIYPRMTIAEPVNHWPGRWQRVVGLAAGQVVVDTGERVNEDDTDLGRLRRFLREGGAAPHIERDGTLMLMRAETPEALADNVAAWMRGSSGSVGVLRTAERASLDAALAAQGLARLGGTRGTGMPLAGAWLALVLALMRSPFDVDAAFDLLAQPDSPVSGAPRYKLARALADAPGLGGERWRETVQAIAEQSPELGSWIETLLTPTNASANDPLDIDEVSRRVGLLGTMLAARARSRVAQDRGRESAEVAAFDALTVARDTLGAWTRALPRYGSIDAGPLDGLLRAFGTFAEASIGRQESGSVERIDDPGAVTATLDTIVWWGFVDPGAIAASPFRAAERVALAHLGVELPDPAELVMRRAAGWRAVLDRARRVVLAVPNRIAGTHTATHPLWSEIRGLTGWTDAEVARVTWTSAQLADEHLEAAAPVVPATWAPASDTWTVDGAALSQHPRYRAEWSVSALDNLFRCPVRFVVGRIAGIQSSMSAPPPMPKMLGVLGHRLMQELHRGGRLQSADEAEVRACLMALIAAEATPLLRPGRASERHAAVRALTGSVQAFQRWLASEGLVVETIEEPMPKVIEGDSVMGGRIDARARDAAGQLVIIDFKWSTRSHASALEEGRAVQLATYARAHAHDGIDARAVFLGLRDGNIVAASANQLAVTSQHMWQTLGPIREALARGEVPVMGVADARDYDTRFALAEGFPLDVESVCDYCELDLLCGRGLELVMVPEADDE